MAYKYEEDQPTKDEEKKLNLGGKLLYRSSWRKFKTFIWHGKEYTTKHKK